MAATSADSRIVSQNACQSISVFLFDPFVI